MQKGFTANRQGDLLACILRNSWGNWHFSLSAQMCLGSVGGWGKHKQNSSFCPFQSGARNPQLYSRPDVDHAACHPLRLLHGGSVFACSLSMAITKSLPQTQLPMDRYVSCPSPCRQAGNHHLMGEDKLAKTLSLFLWGGKV